MTRALGKKIKTKETLGFLVGILIARVVDEEVQIQLAFSITRMPEP